MAELQHRQTTGANTSTTQTWRFGNIEVEASVDLAHGLDHLSELVLRPGDGPITSRDVRSLPVGELARLARAGFAKQLNERSDGRLGPTMFDESAATAEVMRELADDFSRPGRRGRDDLFYADVAAAYVKASTRTRAPIQQLATDYELDRKRLRNTLHEARRRGLLTPGKAGIAGGELTEKALDLLADYPMC